LNTEGKQRFVVVAIPSYNEENSIGDIVLEAAKHVDKVLVIDDGSSDATSKIAESQGALTIKHKRNMGYGAAIRSCFETARKIGADVMIILDGDGQHDPKEIPILLKSIMRDNVDIVIGSRFLGPTNDGMPRYRHFGIMLMNIVTNFVIQSTLSDVQSGFRAYSKKAIEKMVITEDGMGASSEILIHAARIGLRISEVQITCKYLKDGSTENPILHGADVLMAIFRTALRQNNN
jgi:glycosyltransferase involved in cell wall biosynthesis